MSASVQRVQGCRAHSKGEQSGLISPLGRWRMESWKYLKIPHLESGAQWITLPWDSSHGWREGELRGPVCYQCSRPYMVPSQLILATASPMILSWNWMSHVYGVFFSPWTFWFFTPASAYPLLSSWLPPLILLLWHFCLSFSISVKFWTFPWSILGSCIPWNLIYLLVPLIACPSVEGL